MSTPPDFEAMLTGGHPNSLGRTIEVVDMILADSSLLEALYQCYMSSDEVVRLRTSNAIKRVWRQHPDWLVPYIDRFLTVISRINQDSTRWTLAQFFEEMDAYLTPEQHTAAIEVLKRNLSETKDWIVTINTVTTLGGWAKTDAALYAWLMPHLERLSSDSRKTVASKVQKIHTALQKR